MCGDEAGLWGRKGPDGGGICGSGSGPLIADSSVLKPHFLRGDGSRAADAFVSVHVPLTLESRQVQKVQARPSKVDKEVRKS